MSVRDKDRFKNRQRKDKEVYFELHISHFAVLSALSFPRYHFL